MKGVSYIRRQSSSTHTNIMKEDSIVLEEPSSSASYDGGGRAIDRHNPIIRDENRLGHGRRIIFPSNSTITITSATTPDHRQNLTPAAEGGDKKKKSIVFNGSDGGFISPTSSSRCLLGDKLSTFNFSSEFDHVLAPPPPPSLPLDPLKFKCGKTLIKKKDDDLLVSLPPPPPSPPPRDQRFWFLNDEDEDDDDDDDDSASYSPPKPPPLPPPEPLNYYNRDFDNKQHDDDPPSSATPKPPSPPASSEKVVVLEVSLHCRGCERKMKKHISKIQGITSFKIDFAAKKVTVVGDVTPLAVLTSVMKVKNAKILTPATISSSS